MTIRTAPSPAVPDGSNREPVGIADQEAIRKILGTLIETIEDLVKEIDEVLSQAESSWSGASIVRDRLKVDVARNEG